MSEAEKLCDVIGIIHGGRLLAEGTLAEIRVKTGEQDLEESFMKIVAAGGGRMSASTIGTIYAKEIRDLLRDRRTVISTIVIPTVVMPLIVFGFISLASRIVTRARWRSRGSW